MEFEEHYREMRRDLSEYVKSCIELYIAMSDFNGAEERIRKCKEKKENEVKKLWIKLQSKDIPHYSREK